MRIVLDDVWDALFKQGQKVRLNARSKPSTFTDANGDPKFQLWKRLTQNSSRKKIELNDVRIIVIEGVSGSGKDTFQAYLKEKLASWDVYDFSEGELLHSWKHIPIEGVLKLKVEFMRIFVNYLREIVSREKRAVFLLNRFHLSTYASIKTRQPELKAEYDRIIEVLRTLPVHVFILRLDENEIKKRSLHSERSGIWPKLQRQMIANDGFSSRISKYISQQSLMIEAATSQRIPYSIIKFLSASEIKRARDRIVQASDIARGRGRTHAKSLKISRRKRELPAVL